MFFCVYSHIPQFRERKNRIVNTSDQADEEPADEELAAPEPGFAKCEPTADVQEINALKTLENPAHRGAIGRFVDLIGDGLVGCQQLATQPMFGQPVHQQAEHHDEAQRNHALRLLDEHGGSQKHGIFEKTKPPLDASLLFVRRDHLLRRKALRVQDVGGHNESRFLAG